MAYCNRSALSILIGRYLSPLFLSLRSFLVCFISLDSDAFKLVSDGDQSWSDKFSISSNLPTIMYGHRIYIIDLKDRIKEIGCSLNECSSAAKKQCREE